jgi:hypothetical protein
MKFGFLVAGASLAVGVASSAHAIVIRDDVADSVYQAIGAAPLYASVGRVIGRNASSGFSGSGTLIGNHYVLTAGHVTSGATSLSLTLGGQTFQATSWATHPSWTGNVLLGGDIGLMYFAQDLTAATGIQGATLYRGSSEAGRVATMVGYGLKGTGLTGGTSLDGIKRGGLNLIDVAWRGVLLADFDNPHNTQDSLTGSAVPIGLEATISPGDSGGGMFITIGGVSYLAGVNSFDWALLDGNPNSDYGDVEGETRVSAYVGWIDAVLNGGIADNMTISGTFVTDLRATAVAVPEPASLAFLSFGLAAFGALRRRR